MLKALHTADLITHLFQRSPSYHRLSDEELQRLKETMCEIADDFVAFCEKHDLQYMMAFGTALGAVRHHGFVPWDDDMDFYMPRKDYMRFLQTADEELGDKYYIRSVSRGDQGMRMPTCHIRKKHTRYVNYGDLVNLDAEPAEVRGKIYIDVFPLDDVPNNLLLRRVYGGIATVLLGIMSCIQTMKSVDILQRYGVTLTAEEKKQLRLKCVIGSVLNLIPLETWCRWFDRFVSSWHHDASRYIACYEDYKCRKHPEYPREQMLPVRQGEFEGRKWALPADAERYLTQFYGTWQQLPPPSQRKTHPVFELNFEED